MPDSCAGKVVQVPRFGVYFRIKVRIDEDAPLGVFRVNMIQIPKDNPVNIPVFHRGVRVCRDEFIDQGAQTIPIKIVAAPVECSDVQRFNRVSTSSTL